MHEMDLVRGADHDVLKEPVWTELVRFIKEFRPFCIIATPPCSTYSRARHLYKRHPGPRPIRSREHPGGFPWLSDEKMEQAQQGTALATKAWDLCELAEEVGSFYLSEFPEDLGATDTGVPASLWQMPQFANNLVKKGMQTFAIFQCEFGAATPKPTRFFTDLRFFEGNFYVGVPCFDKQWKYLGPLPKSCPHPGQHEPLIGVNADGKWKTAPAAHYPGLLCKFLAGAIYRTWHNTSSASLGQFSSEACAEKNMEEVTWKGEISIREMALQGNVVDGAVEHPCNIQSGCQGPPMTAKYADRSEQFCDGLGLCSAGRWHPNLRQRQRTEQQTNYCNRLAALIDGFCRRKLGDLARATLKLALGKFVESPFTASDLEELRAEWFKLLPDPDKAKEIPKGQPFLLHALAQSARLMGDPDTDIIDGLQANQILWMVSTLAIFTPWDRCHKSTGRE